MILGFWRPSGRRKGGEGTPPPQFRGVRDTETGDGETGVGGMDLAHQQGGLGRGMVGIGTGTGKA